MQRRPLNQMWPINLVNPGEIYIGGYEICAGVAARALRFIEHIYNFR